jgi:hypothetical protein
MGYDGHKNFAFSAVATAPSPATSGTTLVVTAADGAKFPAVPFNATIKPANTNPTSANAEIVRVTTVSTDTLTITRAQEGTSARTVIVGDEIYAGPTSKTLTDAEALKWYGALAGAMADGDPGRLMMDLQQSANIAATPTNITTSVARICYFILPFDLVVNKIRFYGVGAVTTTYQIAIYKTSDLSRVTAQLSITTAANAFGSIAAGPVTLTKDTSYFIAVSVNATGTTAGLACVGTTNGATLGQIQVAPTGWPGNMDVDGALMMNGGFGQFAVTSGALPNPAATIAAQGSWTGGFPALWLDNNNA